MQDIPTGVIPADTLLSAHRNYEDECERGQVDTQDACAHVPTLTTRERAASQHRLITGCVKVAPFFWSPLTQNHTPFNLQPVWGGCFAKYPWRFKTLWIFFFKVLGRHYSACSPPQREPRGGSKGPGGSCELFNKFISKHFLFFPSFFSAKRNLFWFGKKQKQNRVKISHFNYTKKKTVQCIFFFLFLK